MKNQRRWQKLYTLGLGLTFAGLTGCQTWVGGMTLPTSGAGMRHPPQYVPPSPPFPLPRELASMEAQAEPAAAAAAPADAAVPGGAPVVPGP